MSGFEPDEEEDFARPFLSQPLISPDDAHSAEQEANEASEADDIRAYLLTGGRTGVEITLAIETMVTSKPTIERSAETFERRAILELCQQPNSVAEVAALVGVPLGVARVLVSDLLTEGLLTASAHQVPITQDVSMIERLIHGFAAL